MELSKDKLQIKYQLDSLYKMKTNKNKKEIDKKIIELSKKLLFY